ncbi:MAG: hypothetical protein GTN73_00830 [Candidatus Aminicenantes bacterium]|nr:hypothetical protein [Candidatus Aminicenantes bacterium]
MKKLFVSAILMLIVVFPGALNAKTPPSYGFDLLAKGKYVWRGMPYNSEAVLWPDVWISWEGFTVTIWGSMDLSDVKEEQWKLTDIFYYFDYSKTIGKLNFSIGYAHYTFPGYQDMFPTTGEIYGMVGTGFGEFQASLAAYLDIDDANGLYITPKLSRSFSFGQVASTFSVSLGFANKKHNQYYFYLGKSGFTDLTVELGFSISPKGPLGNHMSFSFDLNYSKILDGELADQFADDSNFWWGIGINLFY